MIYSITLFCIFKFFIINRDKISFIKVDYHMNNDIHERVNELNEI